MRVLVTGAAGFLGSHLTDRLLGEGHSVVGVDNLSTGNRENIAHLSSEPRFQFIEHDICQPFGQILSPAHWITSSTLPRRPALLITCASALKPCAWAPSALRMHSKSPHKYSAGFLHASTSECYGDPLEHPQKEDYWGNVNPVGPRSVYDESKRFAEALVMAYHRYRGVNTHLVRIFNTYGPRLHPNDGRVISNFLMQALRSQALTIYGDGLQTRSFCYVDDLIEGILRLSRSSEHMPVNIGNPNEFTILECAQAVLDVTGSKSELRFEPLPQDDPARRRPDISKARALLGWEPQISLHEGLKKSLDFFACKAAISA